MELECPPPLISSAAIPQRLQKNHNVKDWRRRTLLYSEWKHEKVKLNLYNETHCSLENRDPRDLKRTESNGKIRNCYCFRKWWFFMCNAVKSFIHRGQVTTICISKQLSLVQVMVCYMFKTCYELDPYENIAIKFYLKFKLFHSRKLIWNCDLQNVSHFGQTSICSYFSGFSPIYIYKKTPLSHKGDIWSIYCHFKVWQVQFIDALHQN